MVEPPRLQIQFDAREEVIPKVFEKYCKDNYKLDIIQPKKEKNPKPGPIARPTFRVLGDKEELIAFFNPWGHAECYQDEFKKHFKKMVKEIEKAAKDALREFQRH